MNSTNQTRRTIENLVARPVEIKFDSIVLKGELRIPVGAPGIVIFAHGSGSSRLSPRNLAVARILDASAIGTLLFDLLTPTEEAEDRVTAELRFNIEMLARRLVGVTRWVARQPESDQLGLGFFGASTGSAAALLAAAALGSIMDAVVSRGGRPDLAGDALERVDAPTLLLVGERDEVVRQLNVSAYARLQCKKALVVVPNATHLFEEPSALEEVGRRAAEWFQQYLKPR